MTINEAIGHLTSIKHSLIQDGYEDAPKFALDMAMSAIEAFDKKYSITTYDEYGEFTEKTMTLEEIVKEYTDGEVEDDQD